jgi:hypothetical protein
MKTLIISTCAEKLHELEFVKPIEDFLEKDCFVKHYSELVCKIINLLRILKDLNG